MTDPSSPRSTLTIDSFWPELPVPMKFKPATAFSNTRVSWPIHEQLRYDTSDLGQYLLGTKEGEAFSFDAGDDAGLIPWGRRTERDLNRIFLLHRGLHNARQRGQALTHLGTLNLAIFTVTEDHPGSVCVRYAEPLHHPPPRSFARASVSAKLAAIEVSYVQSSEWDVLARDHNPCVRRPVAESIPLTHPAVALLLADKDRDVTEELARRQHLPPALATALLTHERPGVRTTFAKYQPLDQDQIIRLLADPDGSVVRATLQHTPAGNLPLETVTALLHHPAPEMRLVVLAHPGTTARTAESLSRDPETKVRQVVAAHPPIRTEALLKLLQDPATRVRMAAYTALHARNALPPGATEALAGDPHWQIRQALIALTDSKTPGRPLLTPELISLLTADPHFHVLYELACHRDMPLHRRQLRLIFDAHAPNLTARLLKGPDLEDDLWQEFATCTDPETLTVLRERHETDPVRLEWQRQMKTAHDHQESGLPGTKLTPLAHSPYPGVRLRLAWHRRHSPRLLAALSSDPSQDVRAALICNDHVPRDTRDQLLDALLAEEPLSPTALTLICHHAQLTPAHLDVLIARLTPEQLRGTIAHRTPMYEYIDNNLTISLQPGQNLALIAALESDPESLQTVAELPGLTGPGWDRLLTHPDGQVRRHAAEGVPKELLNAAWLQQGDRCLLKGLWTRDDLPPGWLQTIAAYFRALPHRVSSKSSGPELTWGPGATVWLVERNVVCAECGQPGVAAMHATQKEYVTLGTDHPLQQATTRRLSTYARNDDGHWHTRCACCHAALPALLNDFYWPDEQLLATRLGETETPLAPRLVSPVPRHLTGEMDRTPAASREEAHNTWDW